ncbi:hypothetical protein GUITHDRAFT_111329 [Guillardia theta CCMP2712]|uniref:RWP-RK domain-containing protein n=1 Tax=Guillardia theta (strain CCMP2712) TaxID=905079 RepID=L1J3I2_GUITC|nr:hypothetical protein GUITHDRAFT_111329 [Guillardia theta CCMP2712]EKX42650.1 hypothetical protein GUITHDRAFT_111329 [Guillardia theta CCMP2712]|eukprot:XP_005829630.1 hypothetical protein GUITHDRAFT_111329 [Guillardia theta CCMP2712]
MEQRPIKIFPRRKQGQPSRGPDVYLTHDRLASFFHMRQKDAAEKLGISLSAMRSACRRLGIERWPYSKSEREEEEGGSKDGDEEDQEEGEIPGSEPDRMPVEQVADAMATSSEGSPVMEDATTAAASGSSSDPIMWGGQDEVPTPEVLPRPPSEAFMKWYASVPNESEDV